MSDSEVKDVADIEPDFVTSGTDVLEAGFPEGVGRVSKEDGEVT
jgi:hypothetical protein